MQARDELWVDGLRVRHMEATHVAGLDHVDDTGFRELANSKPGDLGHDRLDVEPRAEEYGAGLDQKALALFTAFLVRDVPRRAGDSDRAAGVIA